jgi:tetratricopeptide (TPR) repeat protein
MACNLVLAGCFGGKAPAFKSETLLRAETALNRGVRAEQKGEYTEADKFLTEALTISSSVEDDQTRITALINLARLHRLQHDLPSAEKFINQALVPAMGNTNLSAEAAHEKALLELSLGNPAKAQEWAERSIAAERGTLLGSRRNLAARIQLELGNFPTADSLARTALIENRSTEHAEEEANSLRIMGIVARKETRYFEGEQLLQEALSIDKRIAKSSKIAIDLEELATIFQTAGNLNQSALYLERAFSVNSAAGRLQLAMKNQEELAGIYARLGDQIKADTAVEAARKLATEIKSQKPDRSSATINPSSKP